MNCANAYTYVWVWVYSMWCVVFCVSVYVYVLHNIYSFFSRFACAFLIFFFQFVFFFFRPFITFRSSFHHNNQFKRSQVHRKHTNAIYIEMSWTRLYYSNIYILSYNNEWLLLILSSTKVPHITDLLWDDQMGLVYTFNGCNKFHIAIASKSLFGNNHCERQ